MDAPTALEQLNFDPPGMPADPPGVAAVRELMTAEPLAPVIVILLWDDAETDLEKMVLFEERCAAL